MDIIHLDVCGLMPAISLSRYVYYVYFINEYSCKTWIYFLKITDEVFERFKEFKDIVENLFDKKIKPLISNNGGEFTSSEFKDFCKEAGIKRDITTPYNTQHNGVA